MILFLMFMGMRRMIRVVMIIKRMVIVVIMIERMFMLVIVRVIMRIMIMLVRMVMRIRVRVIMVLICMIWVSLMVRFSCVRVFSLSRVLSVRRVRVWMSVLLILVLLLCCLLMSWIGGWLMMIFVVGLFRFNVRLNLKILFLVSIRLMVRVKGKFCFVFFCILDKSFGVVC